MPNYHIYHYRNTGRPYHLLTILLSFCLAITLSLLIYTNQGRFKREMLSQSINEFVPARSALPGRSRESLHTVKAPNESEEPDLILKIEPFRPIPETLLQAVYGQMEYSKTTKKYIKGERRQSSTNSLNKTEVNPAQSKPNTIQRTTKKPPTTTTTKKTTTKKTVVEKSERHESKNIQSQISQSKTDKSYNKTNIQRKNAHQQNNPETSQPDKNTRPKTSSFEHTNNLRLKHVSSACAKFGNYWKNFKPQAEFYHSAKHDLLYCKVAKGGCTFWEQFFSFILRPEGMKLGNYSTMYDIPRWRIHFDEKITPPSYLWSSQLYNISSNSTRFMFTRDPFSRIWSAYVDKIWLPDFWFWLKIGKHRTLNITDRCLYDITFSDFIEHISNKNNSNKHWAPIHHSCNPCKYQPHIIGNMSTFVDDAKYILKSIGLDSYLSQQNHRKRVRLQVKMLVEYNFKRFKIKNKVYKHCNFTEKDLAYRLWKTFQINGYVSKKQTFPTNLTSFNADSVLSSIISNVERHSLSSEASSSQRRFYMHQAYRSVPRKIIEMMLKRFDPDFYLFGFDKNPPFLLKEGDRPKPFVW